MRSIKLIIIVFLLFAGGVSFAAEDQAKGKNSYEKYKVIYERNMFSKDRLPPRQERAEARQVRTTKVLAIYVLRGIAAEAGRAHKFAFVEEQVSGESMMTKIGTTVLGGRITDIQMNYVLFEEDGKTRKIKIGEEFGTTSTTVMTDAEEPADENDDDNKATEEKTEGSSSTEEDDLLKKLMERRKREMGT